MRKEMKKAVSMVLATAMVLTMGNASVLNKKAAAADAVEDAATVSTASCIAALGYMGETSDWDSSAQTIVDGDGEYTVTRVKPEGEAVEGARVVCVDLPGMKNMVTSFAAIKVSDVKVTVDSKDVEVSQENLQVGDLENNGNLRISLYNVWGQGDQALDPAMYDYEKELSVSFKIEGTGWGQKKEVNEYHGYLSFQDDAWNYRNPVNDLTSKDYNYLTQAMLAGDDGAVATDVDITNAVMNKKEKATYTVKIDGINDRMTGTQMNYIILSTDIPSSFTDVKFSNIKLTVDGAVVKEIEDGTPYVEDDSTNTAKKACYSVKICNKWSDEELFNDPNVLAAVASKSMEIQYTIENMPYTVANADKDAYDAALKASTEKPVVTDSPAPSDDGSQTPAPSDNGGATVQTPVPSTPAVVQTPVPTASATVAPTKAPTVKNACTKVKAKKAKVTVKKGKKATLKFTVTAKKKSAKTTDKITATVKNKKIATVSKKSLKKGSATVTIKGKKKGSTTLTVKVGKKSAKVKVKVK